MGKHGAGGDEEFVATQLQAELNRDTGTVLFTVTDPTGVTEVEIGAADFKRLVVEWLPIAFALRCRICDKTHS